MRNKVYIKKEQESVNVIKGRFMDKEQLSFVSQTYFCGTFSSSIGNQIQVSQEFHDEYCGESLVLLNPETNKFLEIVTVPTSIANDSIKTTLYIRNELELSDSSNPIILKSKTAHFTTIKKQRVEDIKSELIEISQEDAQAFSLTNSNYSLYRIYNYYTGENITVKSSHIKVNPTLKQGEMRLQKKQRTFLGLELPKYISNDYWRQITQKIPDNESNDLQTLEDAFTSKDHFLKKEISHEDKEKAKEVIFKYCPPLICVAPVLNSFKTKNNRGLLKLLSDFYVGKATISLLCRRPYESDEGSDIVRMSLSNMNLLGINEMDKIVISHNNTSVKCRVLKLDDAAAFGETNVPTSINYSIGIPAHVRRELGIFDMNTSVKVDRDTGFIFAKSINEQIVPIILTVFSINFLTDPSLWIKALISLAAIPVVVFFNLSSKRKMRNQ